MEKVAQQHTQVVVQELPLSDSEPSSLQEQNLSSKKSCDNNDINSEWSSEQHEDDDDVESCINSAASYETHHSFKQVCFEDVRLSQLAGTEPVDNEMVFTNSIKTQVNKNFTLLNT